MRDDFNQIWRVTSRLTQFLFRLKLQKSLKIQDKYESFCNVLDELKVDKSKVFAIFTKCDGVIKLSDQSDKIANDLRVSNPITISSKSGYGIHKLKQDHTRSVSQSLVREENSTKVNMVAEEGTY